MYIFALSSSLRYEHVCCCRHTHTHTNTGLQATHISFAHAALVCRLYKHESVAETQMCDGPRTRTAVKKQLKDSGRIVARSETPTTLCFFGVRQHRILANFLRLVFLSSKTTSKACVFRFLPSPGRTQPEQWFFQWEKPVENSLPAGQSGCRATARKEEAV